MYVIVFETKNECTLRPKPCRQEAINYFEFDLEYINMQQVMSLWNIAGKSSRSPTFRKNVYGLVFEYVANRRNRN